MKTIFEILLFVIVVILLNSCNTTEPPPLPDEPPKSIKLKLMDVSCTEAFISVSAADTVLPANINLKKDDATMFSFMLTQTDTIVIDTTLHPDINYVYQITALIKGKEESSDTLQVKTLPTTSHNFTWQTFTFGSSTLYDVAIINENDIWAVGEIYADTTGQAYNAVHWNGSIWELKRIYFPTVCGSTDLTPYPAKAIFAFDNGEIWISSSGDKIAILENGIQTDKFCLPSNVSMSINKIWGSSSNDVYVVGNSGSIAHYQNGSWAKIESGTDLPINDIWGIENNEQTKILAIASDKYQITDKKILIITANTVTEISNTGLPWSLSCIWFNNVYKTYTGGDGLYNKYNTQDYWSRIPLPLYYKFSIRGNRLNDIVVCGGLGYVGHFNGISWMNYLGNGLGEISGNYYLVSIKGNKICAVGIADGKAVAIIGTR
jgi:hypothetical protein